MPKSYPVGLVGEQHYQAAISKCSIGEPVSIIHEIGNPYDDLALVAKDRRGNTIGYVPRDSFLRGVYHEQDRSVDATIKEISHRSGFNQVVLEAQISDHPPEQIRYNPITSNLRLARGADSSGKTQTDKLPVYAMATSVVLMVFWSGFWGLLLLVMAAAWFMKSRK